PPPAPVVARAPEPPPEPPPTQPAAAPLVEPPPVADNSGSTRVWLTATFGTIGVAGIAVGTLYGILATSHRNQSNANGLCDSSDACSDQGLSLRHQALNEATVSTIGFIAGGVG